LHQAQINHDAERIQALQNSLQEMGGRDAYQQASQVSTSFHSTSKWILGYLARIGWLYGVPENKDDEPDGGEMGLNRRRRRRRQRQKLKVLEVGAINTQLIDAAKETRVDAKTQSSVLKYNLAVKAIDLKSQHKDIVQQDFLEMEIEGNYHVVVCSMVINCLATPQQRGDMLARLYHQLQSGGFCFLTLPKRCLTESPHFDKSRFCILLRALGFEIVDDTKETPKLYFFVLRRLQSHPSAFQPKEWCASKVLFQGKKFRNDFDIILSSQQVTGEAYHGSL
jgi:25S rRNA (adenine2142-N1)-methyltransferase